MTTGYIPESLDFIEMYEGILLAADTLRSLGMNINLHTYDIKGDTVELTKIIKVRKTGRNGSYNRTCLFS